MHIFSPRFSAILIAVLCATMAAAAQTGTIKGRVVDVRGEGIVGATAQSRHLYLGAVVRDTSGRFEIKNLPVGPDTLRIGMVGYKDQNVPVVVYPDSEIALEIKLKEDPYVPYWEEPQYVSPKTTVPSSMTKNGAQTGTIKGRITNPEFKDSGVAGAQIVALHAGRKMTVMNMEGYYALDSLPPGPDTLIVTAVGFDTRYIPVTLPPDSVLTVNIEMVVQTMWSEEDCYMSYNRRKTTPGHSTMSGQVKDMQSDRPLPNAYISLAADSLDSTGTGHTCCCYTAVSDSEGNYAVHDIAPGYRTLTVSARGYRSEFGKITVNAGRDSSANFALAPVYYTENIAQGGTVIGRVWDSVRKLPFPGAAVSLLDGNKTVTTNQDGVFRMDSLAPGRHVLNITAAGYRSRQISVQVNIGATNRSVDFVLTEGPIQIGK